MRRIGILFLTLSFVMMACQTTGTAAPTTTEPVSVSESTSTPVATAEPTFTATATQAPQGIIHVDTREQEIYPFVDNGKCSLGEAIFAANAGKPKDTCAAGVINETVIELMPGEYNFTQRDQTPPQVEWMVSVVSVGDALPPVIFPLTIRGNGAVLIRDENAEPFRFFELMVNAKLTLDNLTLQNGDVQDDWGGAIYSMNALIDLDNVHFIDNSAENGGAIYFDLGALNIQNSEFIGNHALRSGGGIFVDSSKANITATRFEANESGANGGGLYATTVTLVLTNDLFIKNRVSGENYGSRGGGMYVNHVNLTVGDSQFYQNESPMFGGAIGVNNPELAGIDPDEGDPIEQLQDSPIVSDMLTSIPGFQATLEAHPSGIYVDFHEDAQIHNNCFANNITINPEDPNWTSGLLGRASVADGNYWGDPSGPSGMGPGTGDSVGKSLTFAPFLSEMPAYCDPTLADQVEDNH